jgi:inner membrane protein
MFEELTAWHWLALGLAMLLLETLGIGGILIGMGAGAVAVALILAFMPIHWQLQIALFAVFSFVGTLLFWKYFRAKPEENATRMLNNRKAQLIGMRAPLLESVVSGRGKIQIQDALWTVIADEDFPKGTLVEVCGYEDSALKVKKIS